MTDTLEKLTKAFEFDTVRADEMGFDLFGIEECEEFIEGATWQNHQLKDKWLPLIAEMAEALEWYKINSTDQQCCNEPVTMAHLALAKLDALIKKEER